MGGRIMCYKNRFIKCAIVLSIGACMVFGSGALNPAACAEQVYDITVCISIDMNPLVKAPPFSIFAFDGKGIVRSNNGGKVFDNCSAHVQGMAMYEGKNLTKIVYMKYLDPDGDFIVFRQIQNPGEKEGTTTVLMGTGKWKGVTGGGKAMQIVKGKPVVEGTVQFCNSHKGTLTLPQ